jgi:hypothetical protein
LTARCSFGQAIKLPFFSPFNKNEATAEGFAYHLLVFWREDSEYYTTVVDPHSTLNPRARGTVGPFWKDKEAASERNEDRTHRYHSSHSG